MYCLCAGQSINHVENKKISLSETQILCSDLELFVHTQARACMHACAGAHFTYANFVSNTHLKQFIERWMVGVNAGEIDGARPGKEGMNIVTDSYRTEDSMSTCSTL